MVSSAPKSQAAPVTVSLPSPEGRVQRFQNPNSQGRFVSPGPATADWSDWVTSGQEARASHGRTSSTEVNINNQSVLGIAPSTPGTVTEGQPFLLARFFHYNNPVTYVAEHDQTSVELRLGGQTFHIDADMWESSNQLDGCPAHLYDPSGCRDELTFSGALFSGTVTLGGQVYRLASRGFTEASSGGSCPATPAVPTASSFITSEGVVTRGCLYATLELVRELTITKRIVGPDGAPLEATPTPAPSFTYGSNSSLGSQWSTSFNLSPTITTPASISRQLLSSEVVTINEALPADDPLGEWSYGDIVCRDVTGHPIGNQNGTVIGADASGNGVTTTATGGLTVRNVVGMANTPQRIECTFTNVYTPKGQLTLVKNVADGPGSPSDFTLTATGPTNISGVSGTAAVTSQKVRTGQYTLSESGPSYYKQDGAWTCTGGTVTNGVVTVTDGANVICTVTNKAAYGSVEVLKRVNPADGYTGGDNAAFTGTLTCTGPSAGTYAFSTTVGTPWRKDNLLAGTVCRVTAEDAPSQDLLANSSYYWNTPTLGAQVTVADGQTRQITLTNGTAQRLGQLHIAKTVAPAEGTAAVYGGGAARTFEISYTCTLDGKVVADGTVQQAAGTTSAAISVPAGASCVVTEAQNATQPGDFPDASYTWLAPTNPAPVTITENTASTATVTNTYQRQLGSITLAKAVTGPGAAHVSADARFTVAYQCGTEFTGTVTLAAGESQTVGNLPLNESCTFSEVNPPTNTSAGLPSAYVWGSPTHSGGGRVTVAATPTTATVTNPTIEVYSKVQVSKTIDGALSGLTQVHTFLVDIACTHPVTGANVYTRDNAPVTQTTPFVTDDVPVGSSCTVTEDAPPQSALADDSYTWGATPAAQTVIATPRDGVAPVTITNTIDRVYGGFDLTKVIDDPFGAYASGGFSGTWQCPNNQGAGVPASGTWKTTGAGQATFYDANGVELGERVQVVYNSSCTVTEDTANGARPELTQPDVPIFAWSPPSYAPNQSFTVNGANPNPSLTVTNGVVQVASRLGVEKLLGTHPEGVAGNASFELALSCTSPDGAQTITDTWTLAAGEQQAAHEAVPPGWQCTLTETGVDDADLVDAERYSWASPTWATAPVPLDQLNPSYSNNGYTVTFTSPEVDPDEVDIFSVTNNVTENTATLTVGKLVDGETAGYDGSKVFTMDVVCGTDGADGVFEATLAANETAEFRVPVHSHCTVNERQLHDEGLADASFTWAATSYEADGVVSDTGPTVVVGVNGSTVTVTNKVGRVTAPLLLRKELNDPTGVVDSARTFEGTWQCTYTNPLTGAEEQYPAGGAGTWSATAGAGAVIVADAIPLGASCEVVSEDLSAAPSNDPSYVWQPYQAAAVTVGQAGATLVVSNSVEQLLGTLTMNKALDGAVEGYIGTGNAFTVGYSCTNPQDANSPTVSGTAQIPVGDAPVVISNAIPIGWNCELFESDPSSDLLVGDGSYTWAGKDVVPNSVTLTADQREATATVTNTVARIYAPFAIEKKLQDVPASAVAGRFTGTWQCDYNDTSYAGTWSAPAEGGPAVLEGDGQGGVPGNVPVSSSCRVTGETQPPFTDPSWTWNEPDLGQTVTVMAGQSVPTVTVTNAASRVTSSLTVEKVSGAPVLALVPGATVQGSYSCVYEGNPDTAEDDAEYSGRWERLAGGQAAVLLADGQPIEVPAGSVCTVREDTPDDGLFIDGSYRWSSRSYSPANDDGTAAVLTLQPGADNSVTVTNMVERVYGSVTVDKVVEALPPAAPDAIDRMDDITYTGGWECGYTGNPDTAEDDVTVTGEWSTTNTPDHPEVISGVLVGSQCRIVDEDKPQRPFRVDPSYSWVGSPVMGDPVEVLADEDAVATVTNRFTRLTGGYQLVKDILGATNEEVGNPDFVIDWTCASGDGTPDLSGPNPPITLKADDVFLPPVEFPDGTTCTMTERVPDEVPGYTWLPPYWTAVNYGESGVFQAEGYGATIALPIGDDELRISLYNPVVRNGYTVTKESNPGSGAIVAPGAKITYTLTVTPQPGYARDVVVEDDLAGVLAAATLDEASITASHGTAEVVDGKLTWTLPKEMRGEGPDLSGLPADVEPSEWEPTGPATLSYTVTVADDAWGKTLRNSVVSDSEDPCVGDCEPQTSHLVPAYTLAKTSDPADGSKVKVGDVVTYTLTVRNVGPAPVTGRVVTDDLSDVLDDATLLDPLSPGLSVIDSTLTWQVPDVEPGQSVSVSYQVRVNSDAFGTNLVNVATVGGDPMGSCDGDCATEHPTFPQRPGLPDTGAADGVARVALVGLLAAAGALAIARRRHA